MNPSVSRTNLQAVINIVKFDARDREDAQHSLSQRPVGDRGRTEEASHQPAASAGCAGIA